MGAKGKAGRVHDVSAGHPERLLCNRYFAPHKPA